MTSNKATKTLDLCSISASPAAGLRKQLSAIGPTDLVVISDNTLLNKPLLSELRTVKTPLIFSLGDNSIASRAKAQNMLGRKFKSISTVAVLPQDAASISRVWNKTITSKTAIAQMQRAKAQFNLLSDAKVIAGPGPTSFRSQVINEIASGSPDELFILVGHNENGLIKGPDGTRFALNEFTRALSKHNRQGIVLSCETMSTGPVLSPTILTTKRLLPEQVAMALREAQTQLLSYSHPNLSDFLMEFGKAVNEGPSISHKQMKVVAVIVGGTIVITAAVLASGDEPTHNK